MAGRMTKYTSLVKVTERMVMTLHLANADRDKFQYFG
jgi:hypothetical protein